MSEVAQKIDAQTHVEGRDPPEESAVLARINRQRGSVSNFILSVMALVGGVALITYIQRFPGRHDKVQPTISSPHFQHLDGGVQD